MKKLISLALVLVCMIGISSCSSKETKVTTVSSTENDEYPPKKSLKPAEVSITYKDENDWGSYDTPLNINGLYDIESMVLNYKADTTPPMSGKIIVLAHGKPQEELTGYTNTVSGEVQILDKNGEVIYSRELDSNDLKNIIKTEPGDKVEIYEPFARISDENARKIVKNAETVRIVDLGIANNR